MSTFCPVGGAQAKAAIEKSLQIKNVTSE